jgi:hypothetical protein
MVPGLMLNASYEPLHGIDHRRALTLLASEKAELIERARWARVAFPFDAPADAVGDSSAALYQRTAARRDVVEAERLCARQDGLRLLWRAVDEQDRDD